ncbi:hypothetical protein Poli38472_003544 [Pythium oligandrum]|uniref:Uncharacterized protein n=1 Tax=Pythium oligandrum TaxID=41045 RepID=A0A8K1C706_PYTOL|nr:hypothetical protein Poli38472_003544 [Pythium oligandrum]|eukprot:TMW57619.1 hypothetical protein Poli38472_003544 [Pythium oligandrum]
MLKYTYTKFNLEDMASMRQPSGAMARRDGGVGQAPQPQWTGAMVVSRLLALEDEVRAIKAHVASMVPALVDAVVHKMEQREAKESGLKKKELEQTVMGVLTKTGVLGLLQGQRKDSSDAFTTPPKWQSIAPLGVISQHSSEEGCTSREPPMYEIEPQHVSLEYWMNGTIIKDIQPPLVEYPCADIAFAPQIATAARPPMVEAVKETPVSVRIVEEEPPKQRAYVWGGGEHPVPEDFEFQTKDSVSVAWVKWCCGDAAQGYPPFRQLCPRDMGSKTSRRRLSDLRCAMTPIENLAREDSHWKESLTTGEAESIYNRLQSKLPFGGPTDTGFERRKEIAWPTAVNAFRRGKKRTQKEMMHGGPKAVV